MLDLNSPWRITEVHKPNIPVHNHVRDADNRRVIELIGGNEQVLKLVEKIPFLLSLVLDFVYSDSQDVIAWAIDDAQALLDEFELTEEDYNSGKIFVQRRG